MVLIVKELTVSLQNTDTTAHSMKIWEKEEFNRGEVAGTCPWFPPRGQTEQGGPTADRCWGQHCSSIVRLCPKGEWGVLF